MKPDVNDVVTVGMMEAALGDASEAFGESLCIALREAGIGPGQLRQVATVLHARAELASLGDVRVRDACLTDVVTGFLNQLQK